MTTRAYTESSGANQGTSTVLVERTPGSIRLVEERKQADGAIQQFDVTFDPATLQPSSWTRVSRKDDFEESTVISITNGKVVARTYDAGGKEKKVSSIAVPDAPWCIAPLTKFHAALCVASNAPMGIFRNVSVAPDGALKVAEVAVAELGSTTVIVSAGEFKCRQLKLSPQSALVAALMPPAEMFIGEDAPHPMVKTVLSPTRFSSTIATELEAYTVEDKAAP
ncbi:MAG TPA: hypothetical protein VIH35_09570 [Kiritimatiellia bacterium]